jgi:hypothetical protein
MTSHGTALIVFAVAVAVVLIVAAVVTFDHVNTRVADTDAPPGTIGLAKPHPPLDRAPGEHVRTSTR